MHWSHIFLALNHRYDLTSSYLFLRVNCNNQYLWNSRRSSNFIPNRIQQYNTVCMTNITNSRAIIDIGRIRLSVSAVNRTYELSGKTHVTPFRKYGKHSTGPSTYGPWPRTYSKLFSCKPVLTVCSYGAQSNEICTYGRVSRGTIPRVRRYGLLYLRTVEYDHCNVILLVATREAMS